MKDGLSSEDLVLTGTLSGATLTVAESIASGEISADAVGTSEQAFVGTGSPPDYSSRILHGVAIVPAATSTWVVFGDKFGATPHVAFGENVAGDAYWKTIVTGSFELAGTADTSVFWMACGSV